VARDSQDKREYSEDNIKWIRFLSSLKATGMPLADIVRYAELYYSGDHSIPKRIELLSAYRDALTEEAKRIAGSIEFLNNKIAFYHNKLNSIQETSGGCL
jgi:DNA-binding transcriptional MerR regulator